MNNSELFIRNTKCEYCEQEFKYDIKDNKIVCPNCHKEINADISPNLEEIDYITNKLNRYGTIRFVMILSMIIFILLAATLLYLVIVNWLSISLLILDIASLLLAALSFSFFLKFSKSIDKLKEIITR